MLLFKDKLNETRNRKCILGTHARTHLIGNVVMVIAAQAIKATRHQTRGNNNGGSSGNDGVATYKHLFLQSIYQDPISYGLSQSPL